MKELMDKFLEKIPTDKLYEDLFQPSLKKAGEALSTVIDLSNLILLPLKLANEKSRLYLKANLNRYEKKLSGTKNEDLIQVPEYVGLPILEKLASLNEKFLSEGFINLLAKASTVHTIGQVHPSFINILNNISSDEAKILFHYKNINHIPLIDLFTLRFIEKIQKPKNIDSRVILSRGQLKELIEFNLQDKEETKIRMAWNLTGIQNEVNLDFKGNIDLYIENLNKLGVINIERGTYSKTDEDKYRKLEEIDYVNVILDSQKLIKEIDSQEFKFELLIERGSIEFTEIGKSFLKACMKEIENEG